MKKISQAIIGATLILDVAVVFTFGLAVISSFEDGSRLPETTFVRQPIEGRVAGTMTTNNFPDGTLQIHLISPMTDGEIFSGLKILKAKTSSEVYSVKFTVTRNSNNATGDMSATRVPGTILEWSKEIDTAQMPNESHSITAKAFSIDGTLLAASQTITVNISNSATTSGDNVITPSIALNAPSGGTISGSAQISGTLSNFPTSYSLPIKELQVWQGTNWKKNFPLTRDADRVIGSMDTTTLANGDYTLKIHLVYNNGATEAPLDSSPVSVTVSNGNTTEGGTTTQTSPSVTLNNPVPGTLSGVKEISGTLSNFPTSYSLPIKELQVWQGTTWKKNFPLTSNTDRVIGSMDTNTLANGNYTIKIHLVYNDGTSDKVLDSSPVSVTVSNANTTGGGTTTDPSTGTSGSTGSTSTDNTSTSGTGTSGSTGTTTPPPTSATTTTSVSIVSPAPLTILRTRDNPLVAKTSAAVSGLKFIIHKSGEPVTQFIPIDAVSSDKINWKANMSLMIFNDGEYDITAIVGDIKSASLNVAVQKFAFNWINPMPAQTAPLFGDVPIKVKIGGIYEKDGITPVKGVKVYFYQTNTQSPYSEIYNEQLYQSPGTQEWRLYDWTLKKEKLWKTNNSSNGKYRLIIKVVNESISTNNIWFPTEPIFIEINNQQTVSPSNNSNTSALDANSNQNLNTAATNTAASNSSNITVVGNANLANNTNTDSVQNTNAAIDSATAAVQSDSDQDGLSDEDERLRGTDPNSVDTDKDGLTDFEEIDKYGTDPLKNDTDGDGYLDGEEVQSLHDPLKPPTDPTAAVLLRPKPIEEPKASVKPILESLVVEKIENKEIKTAPSSSTYETNGQPLIPEITENTIILKGKGPADTILTLFIYSVDPLVITVKTDDDGNWEYELDKKLEDGEHELYVTVTDDTGKIQSQSNPIAFFVKEAKAVSPENYRADLAAREPVKTSSADIYLIASAVLVLIAAITGLAVALRRKSGI